MRFCNQCGAALQAGATAPAAAGSGAGPVEPVSERRLVSVLFADLVGFTTLSEARDAEEVRELLSGYFETCRRLIERYGGTVEKFIGDAVMAVWGAPVAHEDDAERAVRAALELVAAVPELAPGLSARAGVLTGEAAVTLGAKGEGMVAGDLVNTASRIQSAAERGTVLVGEATRRATEAAIAYEDAGEHELKGKAEPMALLRALRVTAGRKGAMKAAGLEAPFVGRDRELRLVKELYHASAEEGRAHLVSVIGIAGIGKSRLSWEFEKYIDGLADEVNWHRGRCLSYGDGVAYWALAEMVRMRCRIVEDEDPGSALAKLRETLGEYVPSPDERRWVEPRLAHLLGLEEGVPGDQENLFSAWRIFFERQAEQYPTVLVFEDMQWADAGLLDFLEYLLEWSRSRPLYVLVLARPELVDRRPSLGAGKRHAASISLEPLPAQAMVELLTGLVPGLPEDLSATILQRAEGIPLYAVETVRMLLDQGLLVREGNVYRPAGPIGTLDVPETLHALIAARLDSLAPEERRIVQDGSVLGKTFTRQGLAALTGLSETALEAPLGSLVRKEVLSIQADPRSPERGQYAFLQDIVKHVAYETIARRDRKLKHLAAARHLSSVVSTDEDEIAEVLAAHYLDAYATAPDDPDAEEIRATAREMLVRGAVRASSLAATVEAQRAFQRAIELTDDPLGKAELHERAGIAARTGGRAAEAAAHFERSLGLFDAAGATGRHARVSARLAEILWDRGRLEEGLESMERSLAVLSEEEPDEGIAALAAQVGRFLFFAGKSELAAERIETALDIAERLGLPEVLSEALNTKSLLLDLRGRPREAMVLLRYALEVARENDKPSAALRASYNLSEALGVADRYEEGAQLARDGLAAARTAGNRYWEWNFLGYAQQLYAAGRWDEALENNAKLPHEDWTQARLGYGAALGSGVAINVHRGRVAEAEQLVERARDLADSADVQERSYYSLARASLLEAQGDLEAAFRAAETAFATRESLGIWVEHREAFAIAVDCALRQDRIDRAEELLAIVEGLPAGLRSQSLSAQAARFRARIAAVRGDAEEVEGLFRRASSILAGLSMPFHLAVVRLEHGEWLLAAGREAEAGNLLAEACETFERLGAEPWIARARAAAPVDAGV